MKFNSPTTLKNLADKLKLEYIGDSEIVISGLNEINVVEEGDIIFVDHPKYYEKALKSKASAIIIDQKVDAPKNKGILISPKPFEVFNQLIIDYREFMPSSIPISRSAKIGTGSYLQPGVYVGDNVVIGEDCIIHANVVIYDKCIIGNNVTIHANTVIGSDAFYFQKGTSGYSKFNCGGRVVIEDNVEIGASCTIDRGVTNETFIGKGSKLDNQVHIGHDTKIGSNCLMAAQVGIAGACTIEDNVIFWGQVGVGSGINIGENAILLGQCGVTKNVASNTSMFGTPADEAQTKLRELASLRNLPYFMKSNHKT